MSQLYVDDSAAHVGVEENRITVKHKDELLRSIPIESVDGITIFGAAQVSTRCIGECLRRGIDVQYYSAGGVYFGKLASTSHVNTGRQKAQAALSDDDAFRLGFARRIVRAKIRNQITVIRRYNRSASGEATVGGGRSNTAAGCVKAMQDCEGSLALCETLEALMGYEGNAAREYFKALSVLVDVPEFKFSGRSRRPPKDAFNSMLSLGYTILMYEIYGAIESKGLNPYFGFLHSDREKHPTLASDLMEEWRAVIVDAVMMSLVNGHEIGTEHFHSAENSAGVFIEQAGLRIILGKLEGKFAAKSKYLAYADYAVAFRRAIEMQAGELVKAVEKEDPSLYEPIRIR